MWRTFDENLNCVLTTQINILITRIFVLFSSIEWVGSIKVLMFICIMETISKWSEHVVRDFLQERENRATDICNIPNTVQSVCGKETIQIK